MYLMTTSSSLCGTSPSPKVEDMNMSRWARAESTLIANSRLAGRRMHTCLVGSSEAVEVMVALCRRSKSSLRPRANAKFTKSWNSVTNTYSYYFNTVTTRRSSIYHFEWSDVLLLPPSCLGWSCRAPFSCCSMPCSSDGRRCWGRWFWPPLLKGSPGTREGRSLHEEYGFKCCCYCCGWCCWYPILESSLCFLCCEHGDVLNHWCLDELKKNLIIP